MIPQWLKGQAWKQNIYPLRVCPLKLTVSQFPHLHNWNDNITCPTRLLGRVTILINLKQMREYLTGDTRGMLVVVIIIIIILSKL